MKNIEASVGAVPTQGKKKEEAKVEEDEYTEHRNEMYFFLMEHPEYRIAAIGRWLENSKGEMIGDADTYFLHITNGSRCDGVGECLDGWSEQNEEGKKNGKHCVSVLKNWTVSNKSYATKKVLVYRENTKN